MTSRKKTYTHTHTHTHTHTQGPHTFTHTVTAHVYAPVESHRLQQGCIELEHITGCSLERGPGFALVRVQRVVAFLNGQQHDAREVDQGNTVCVCVCVCVCDTRTRAHM